MILEPFALLDQVFHHVISLDLLMQPVKIGHARPLNIQRTTNFVYFMRPVRVDFMEELFLRKNPRYSQGVHILGLAPLGKLSEHELDFCLVKFPSAAEAQDVRLIEHESLHVNDLLAAHPILNQVHHVFLLWR